MSNKRYIIEFGRVSLNGPGPGDGSDATIHVETFDGDQASAYRFAEEKANELGEDIGYSIQESDLS